jgi:Bacterial type II/III secretion system short domain
MFHRTAKIITIFLLLLLLSTSVLSQQKQESNQQKQETAKSPDYVDFSGFKGKIFEIKHGDPRRIASIITPLGSGFKGAMIQASRDPNFITVRDFPENIAVIEEAIKRLDVAPPPPPPLPPPSNNRPPNLEMRMFLLIASNIEGAANQYPDELKDVLKQLQSTINYKNYYLLTPVVQRIFATAGAYGSGVTTVGAPLFEKQMRAVYDYNIRQFRPEGPFAETKTFFLNDFEFSISGASDAERDFFGKAKIKNQLMIRDGEKVVLGTASLMDKALVLVLSVKVVP